MSLMGNLEKLNHTSIECVPNYESREFQKLLKGFNTADFSVEKDYWMKWQKLCDEIFAEMISNAANQEEIKLWLCDCLNFVRWFQQFLPVFDAPSICMLCFALKTVQEFLKFYEVWNKLNDLSAHLQKTRSLHDFVLKLLNQYVDVLKIGSEDEFSLLNELIASLCAVGEMTAPFSIEKKCETWKCIVKLTHCNAKWSITEAANIASLGTPQTMDPAQVWAKRPLRFLLQEISRSARVIFREETLKQPIQHVEKYLRVTLFFVKLLHRLTVDFKHSYYPVPKDLFDTLGLVAGMPMVFVGTEIEGIVNKYMRDGLNLIFGLVYKNIVIRDSFMVFMQELKWKTNFALVLQYLQAVITNRDSEYLDDNWKNYAQIFEYLLKDSTLFVSSDQFNTLIEIYASFVILSGTSSLKNFFKANVLQADFQVAYASVEVLMIASRFRNFNVDELTAELWDDLCYWRRCNDSFALVSSNPKQLLVHKLLENYFKLFRLHNKTADSKFRTELQTSRRSCQFFIALGLLTTPSNEQASFHLSVQLTDEVAKLLQKADVGTLTVDDFYKMVTYIKLFATCNIAPKKILLDKIFELLIRICSSPNFSKKGFFAFINACFHLAFNCMNAKLNESDITLRNVVERLKYELASYEHLHHGNLVLFLDKCASSTAFEILATLKAHKIKSILPYVLAKVQDENCVKYYNDNEEIYQSLLLSNVFHQSHGPSEVGCDMQPNNNLRKNDTAINVKSYLSDFHEKTNIIKSLSNQIDCDDIAMLKSIIYNLKNIIDCKTK